MKSNLLIGITLAISFFTGCNKTNPETGEEQDKTSVHFPKVSEPVQITSDEKEHLFASYYGINSFSASQKYVYLA